SFISSVVFILHPPNLTFGFFVPSSALSLHSFPTRRSSDLVGQSAGAVHVAGYLTLAKHDGRAPLAAAILLTRSSWSGSRPAPFTDRKSTRLNSSTLESRMPSSA